MDDLDIRLWGRSWRTDEMSRHDDLTGRLEMWEGKLCLDEEQRCVLLGALLEHVGTACALKLSASTCRMRTTSASACSSGSIA